MKTAKPLWRISVATSLEAEDAVAELLGSLLGIPATAYFKLETGVSLVSVYTDKKVPVSIYPEISAGLNQIKSCGLQTGPGKIAIVRVKREDWAESWKRHFQPIDIRGALLVKPSWSKKRPRKDQPVVILDPGLSFGTGQHATTAFCLSEIVRRRKHGTQQSFLDIGTGSGILAIAAAKLGYQPVHAFDIDPDCVRVARENACLNGAFAEIKIKRDDVTKLALNAGRKFDLICANLISNLLMAESKKIVARLAPNGTLVLAGILRCEFAEVQQAFEDLGMELHRCKTDEEWCSGSFSFPRSFHG
jgi:ribosomal protein L11 methyltransferase